MAVRAMQEATFMILTALADGSQHGYGIITDVQEISGGRVRLRAGDPVHGPGPAPRGRADRGGPGRGRGRAAAPVLPAHPRGHQAARRRGGPAAGSCRRGAEAAGPGRGDGDMTDQEHLERAYRRLLAWYPREFRREHGPEILAVLMADARDGQRRPGLAAVRGPDPQRPVDAAAARRATVGAHGAGRRQAHVRGRRGQHRQPDHLAGPHRRHQGLPRNSRAPPHRGPGQPAEHAGPSRCPIVLGLVPIALWLWMARANGRGRNWARSLSTVLFGLATLTLTSVFRAAGDQYQSRRCISVPSRRSADRPRADLAGRRRRGVAAVAPGLHRVLQAAGLHAGPAPGADGRTRPSGTNGRTHADQGTVAASRVSHRPALATDGRPRK